MSGTPVRSVAVVGAGPAGAFCALELARLLPDTAIDLYDRDDRGPGAGIVLTDEFAERLRTDHPDALRLPPSGYASWDKTVTTIDGERIPSGAFGMSGISRQVFHAHVRELAARNAQVRPDAPSPTCRSGLIWWCRRTARAASCAGGGPTGSARPSPRAAPATCG